MILGIILLLIVIYFILLWKLKEMNNKIYRYQEEVDLLENNVLIVYQPSRHKTTSKIKDLIKAEVSNKGYGNKCHTLTKEGEDYSKYRYVVFVLPVYFGQVNQEAIRVLANHKIKNLLIVYNGLSESNNEDLMIKKVVNKYSWIKVHTKDIDLVKEFINKEVI